MPDSVKGVEIVDLTPEGLKQNPAGVAGAMKERDEAASALLGFYRQFFSDYKHELGELVESLHESDDDRGISEAFDTLEEYEHRLVTAEEKFLKAVAGK